MLVFLLFALCIPLGSHAAVDDEASSYYPLETGNVWTYRFSNNKSTARYEVVGYLNDQRAWIVRCSTKMIDVNITTESLIGSRGGSIVHIGGTDIKSGNSRLIYVKGDVVLRAPLKAGCTWEYDKDNRYNDMACRVRCRVVKITDCEVKAGRFEKVCLVQRTTSYFDRNKRECYREVRNEYYAPLVGEIMEEYVDDLGRASVQMELVEYKVR